MQNDPKDGWWKGRNVFSPAIKEISLVIDMVQVLVSWHVDCCPLDPNFVVRAKPKSSRTSGASLSSQFLSSLFTCQQLRPQATSLHARVAQRLTITVKMMPFTCVSWPYWPLIWVLAYFWGNLGQFWCRYECLRPFIIANHVIHPQRLCFQPTPPRPTPPHRTHNDVFLTVGYFSTSALSFSVLTIEHQWMLLLSLC